MHAGVVGVLKLLRHEYARVFLLHSADIMHRPGNALRIRRRDQLGAQRLDQLFPLFAHSLRHHNPHFVALEPADQGHADPGVSRGGLDDNRIRAKPAVALGPLEHGPGNTVLDDPAGVEELRLGINPLPFESQERRVPDQIQNVVGQHGVSPPLSGLETLYHVPDKRSRPSKRR